MMEEAIFELARELGHVTGADERLLHTLCPAAAAELRTWLRPGVTEEDCAPAFLLGAAWLSLATLAAAQDDGVERFTAGDLTVQQGGAASRADRFRAEARLTMGRCIEDRDFCFWGVQG